MFLVQHVAHTVRTNTSMKKHNIGTELIYATLKLELDWIEFNWELKMSMKMKTTEKMKTT